MRGIIKTRRQAAHDGDKQYNTGKPCVRKHIGPRYTSSGVCVECNKLAAEAYRLELREALQESKNVNR